MCPVLSKDSLCEIDNARNIQTLSVYIWVLSLNETNTPYLPVEGIPNIYFVIKAFDNSQLGDNKMHFFLSTQHLTSGHSYSMVLKVFY